MTQLIALLKRKIKNSCKNGRENACFFFFFSSLRRRYYDHDDSGHPVTRKRLKGKEWGWGEGIKGH